MENAHIVVMDENGKRNSIVSEAPSTFETQTDPTAQRLKAEMEDLRQRKEADAAACIAGLGISGAQPVFEPIGPWIGM